MLAPNGIVAVYGSRAPAASIPFQFLLQNSIALKFFLVYLMPSEMRERATADITGMLERGELIHNVAQSYDLADIVTAHEAMEAGKAMGNIVVRMVAVEPRTPNLDLGRAAVRRRPGDDVERCP